MSQRITRVAGILDVMSVLSWTWILHITKVECPVSGHRRVCAHGSPAEVQRQRRWFGGGVVVFCPVRSWLSGGGGGGV